MMGVRPDMQRKGLGGMLLKMVSCAMQSCYMACTIVNEDIDI